MTRSRPIARYLGLLALVLAVIAFSLGSAPFTPAVLLTVLALPLAGAAALVGARRLAALAAYWSVAALAADPLADMWDIRVDGLLLAMSLLGLVLSAFLYVGYLRAERLP